MYPSHKSYAEELVERATQSSQHSGETADGCSNDAGDESKLLTCLFRYLNIEGDRRTSGLYMNENEDDENDCQRLCKVGEETITCLQDIWNGQGASEPDVTTRRNTVERGILRSASRSVLGKVLSDAAWMLDEDFGVLMTQLGLFMATDDTESVRELYGDLVERHRGNVHEFLSYDRDHNKSGFLETLMVHTTDFEHPDANPFKPLKLDQRSRLVETPTDRSLDTTVLEGLRNTRFVQARVPTVQALAYRYTPPLDDEPWSQHLLLTHADPSHRIRYMPDSTQF